MQLLEISTNALALIEEVKSHPIITGRFTLSQKMSFSITTRLLSLFLLQFSARSLLTGGFASSEDFQWSTLPPIWRVGSMSIWTIFEVQEMENHEKQSEKMDKSQETGNVQ